MPGLLKVLGQALDLNTLARLPLAPRAESYGPGGSVSEDLPQRIAESLGIHGGAGGSVSERKAVGVPAVYSCVKVIAENIATLPCQVLQREENGDKSPLPEHPVSVALHDLANEETTAQGLRETKLVHLLLRGKGYARIVRDRGGQLRELWTMQPSCTQPFRKEPGGPLFYEYSERGMKSETLRRDQVWRTTGLSLDGFNGLSPMSYHRLALGVAADLQQTSSSTLENGVRPSGLLYPPPEQEVVDQAEKDNLQASFNDKHGGPGKAGGVPILEAGWKYEKVGMTFLEAQFIEQMRFSVAEIARLFRVPLHMLYEHDAQPRANMEQASLEFVVYTLRPWLVRLEQSAFRDLLLPFERQRLRVEHNVMGLLRGDLAARTAYYAAARQWGWLNINDILRLENMNTIGAKGADHLQPSNMIPVGTAPDAWLPKPATKEAA